MTWTAESLEDACRTLIPGYDPWAGADAFTFDIAEALRVVSFFEECLCLTNARWMGQPFLLRPWQAAIVGNLFGWRRLSDGLRRYRKCLIFTARKSGKTELAAGIGNALLFIDGEPAPEIVTAAGNAEQAARIFNAASTMVNNEPELTRRSRVFRRAIECVENAGTMKVINAAAKTKHGGNLHAALIDELHVHPDADLVDVLETSMRARSQPLVLYTTTAGDNPESIAGEVYHYACQVRDSVVDDPEFLPVIYEIPKDADVKDPANWKLAQPNLGVTVPVEEYERDLRKALAVPRQMTVFKQLCCNQWVHAAKAWLSLEQWQACGQKFSLEDFKGCRAALGIDLSSTTDTTAVVAAIEREGKVYIWPEIFIPANNTVEGALRRQKQDRAPYQLWVQQGYLTATDGDAVDYYAVERRVQYLCDLLDVATIGADSNGQQNLLSRLINFGLPVEAMRQGWSLSAATKEVERMVVTRELVHPKNPCFSWQVSCAAVKTDDQENAWVVKGRSRGRVDAVVAMNMAVNGLKFSGKQAASKMWDGEVSAV